ncbi:class I SAM-dependent methyltransferase [Deltaproteobacteria bacterium TL4]
MISLKPTDEFDTSRISITAHYTGYVWYENGLSHEAFVSWFGKVGYHSLDPWMKLGKKILGIADLETILLQRHHIIDHLLEKAIEEQGLRQVIELACGLSPRGFRFIKRYGDQGLTYLETDLPTMALRKKQLLTQIDGVHASHQVVPCNILIESGKGSLQEVIENHFDPKKPIAVITEGLINYFDLKTITGLWRRITKILNQNSGGIYLSDNFSMLKEQPYHSIISVCKKGVEFIGRGTVHPHFESFSDAESVLSQSGFKNVVVHDPKSYVEILTLPKVLGPSFIHVLEGTV